MRLPDFSKQRCALDDHPPYQPNNGHSKVLSRSRSFPSLWRIYRVCHCRSAAMQHYVHKLSANVLHLPSVLAVLLHITSSHPKNNVSVQNQAEHQLTPSLKGLVWRPIETCTHSAIWLSISSSQCIAQRRRQSCCSSGKSLPNIPPATILLVMSDNV